MLRQSCTCGCGYMEVIWDAGKNKLSNIPYIRMFFIANVTALFRVKFKKKQRKLHGSVYVLRVQMRAQLDMCYLSFISLGSHATRWFDVGPASQTVDQHRTNIG